jgi:hypothetical protein
VSERLWDYRHPAAGFALPLPSEWHRVEDPRPGVLLVAVEPERGPWFRANAVVTVERLDPPTSLAAWQDEAVRLLPQVMADLILLDVEDTQLGGRPARRTLIHHATGDAGAVTAELWATVDRGNGYTLTTSVGSLEYDDLADMFAAMAQGLRLDAGS